MNTSLSDSSSKDAGATSGCCSTDTASRDDPTGSVDDDAGFITSDKDSTTAFTPATIFARSSSYQRTVFPASSTVRPFANATSMGCSWSDSLMASPSSRSRSGLNSKFSEATGGVSAGFPSSSTFPFSMYSFPIQARKLMSLEGERRVIVRARDRNDRSVVPPVREVVQVGKMRPGNQADFCSLLILQSLHHPFSVYLQDSSP